MKTKIVASALAVIFAQSATAQSILDFELGVGLSTFGPIIEGLMGISDRFAARGFIASGPSSTGTIDDTEVTYSYDAKISGFGAFADYFPFDNGFKLSGGFVKSNIGADFTGAVNNVQVGDTNYLNAEVKGELKFKNEIAPVLAVGYDWRLTDRITLGSSLGAAFVNGIDVTARSTGTLEIAQADIDKEIQKINDDLPSMNAIPYLAISLRYHF